MFEYLFERFGDENVLNSHENNFTMQKKKHFLSVVYIAAKSKSGLEWILTSISKIELKL